MSLESLPRESVLDVQGALARFEGDRQLFRDIIEYFLEDSPPLLRALKKAIETSDASSVGSAAHSLRGLVAGCGGVRAAQAAERVENAVQAGDVQNLALLVDALECELEQLRKAACAFRR